MKAFVLLLSLALFLPYATEAMAQEEPEWLIMVYMNGDRPSSDSCYFSLEEPGIADINEMERGIGAKAQVVVEFDRGQCDSSNDGWDTTRRYLITPDKTEETGDEMRIDSKLIEDLGEKDMGDPETLIDFARWACDTFPANRKILIIWDHGSGWIDSYPQDNEVPVKSVCVDNYDELTMSELDYAMSEITSQYDIDILGFDACLMQMLEVVYELREYVPIIIGSENVEPETGWTYDPILRAADSTSDPEELARAIVQSYDLFSTSTLSAVRCSDVDGVVESLNNLCSKIIEYNVDTSIALDSTSYFQHTDAANKKDYADLYSFAESLLPAGIITKEAEDLMQAIELCMISEAHGSRIVAHGLSIWLPRSYDDSMQSYGELKISESQWDEFLRHSLNV